MSRSTEVATTSSRHSSSSSLNEGMKRDFLTLRVNGQLFGIPILQVQDVLGAQRVTRIPLSPPQVAGSLNLRGRIVTAIDMRRCLTLAANTDPHKKEMSVVVENDSELYSLIIDQVGDVLSLSDSHFENTPATLDPTWRSLALGVYRLPEELLVILDVPKLLNSLSTSIN
jgi:purine-binding chemotaxis protein CheW